MIFLDASVVVKAYVPEQGSSAVRGAIARLRGKLYLTRAVVLEVLGAFAKKRRKDEITLDEYSAAREAFLTELQAQFEVLELDEADYAAAFRMLDVYHHTGVSPLDVLHLACALHLRAESAASVTVASSDGALLSVARTAGLTTFDPETQPFGTLLALMR
ncbi:MAG TPA: type II toxin-antitoxin system VapC family toxin [Longimicrobiaceae bacterium]|nr:type II toxin-antitoxin system VapC family toxin [Longimicrobiaceae bacterium]